MVSLLFFRLTGKENSMKNNESKWDKKLQIVTVGRDDSSEDENHYPYEPTPYTVLERLAESGYLSKKNVLVDYGSGKGRVDLFLNWKVGCKTIGIEFDSHFYDLAITNQKNRNVTNDVQFLLMNAEDYVVDKEADCFYFFNPFSLNLLRFVIARIKDSWYENPRKLQLFFYYPSDEYICYLMGVDEIDFVDEIECGDLFHENDIRERIMIFEMNELY